MKINEISRDNLKSLILSLDEIINHIQILLKTLDKAHNDKIHLNEQIKHLTDICDELKGIEQKIRKR